MMQVLFVHQNFPAQFRHLSRLLAARGDTVVALAMNGNGAADACGARVVVTQVDRPTGAGHPWARDFDTKVIRGEATLRTALRLRDKGFVPDVIVAHPGWGDTLFVKDVWPAARLALYCEYFYRAEGGDHDFDPEFAPPETALEARIRTRLRNLPQRLHFDVADAGLAPTRFQANTYPAAIRDRITVIHDGIDTDAVAPGTARPMRFPNGRILHPGDEIVTFVSRTLEPYRGIHILLRAWPAIQRARPAARLVVVGRGGTGYGAAPPAGVDWAPMFLDEIGDAIDPVRILFAGALAYPAYLNLLRLSSLHIYLTYPFVLSWSMLEAMATGCAVLGSDTAPVREFLCDGDTGLLTPFLDPAALAARAIEALADAPLRRRLGAAARAHVVATADLHRVSAPRQLAWIDALALVAPRGGRSCGLTLDTMPGQPPLRPRYVKTVAAGRLIRSRSLSGRGEAMSRRILIAGASIAGNIVAWWLGRAGFDVTVVERAPGFRDGGQNIDVRGVGREILRRMALERVALDRGTGEEGAVWIEEDGSVAAAFPADGTDGPTAEMEILRGDLARLLYDDARGHAGYRFGDEITGIEQDDAAATVTFASGLVERYDTVVVAEGVGSATREAVFAGENQPRWMDLTIAYFTIPRVPDDDRMWRWYNAPGGRSVSLRPDRHGTARAMLSVQQPPGGEQDWDVERQKDWLRERFADAGWQSERVLAGMAGTDDFYFDVLRQVRMPRWSKGRVVLTGDAAWCATPIAGYGTTLAVAGAYVLAAELIRTADVPAALAAYEAAMRPMVEDAQGVPKIAPRLANPHSRLGIRLLHGVLHIASRPTVRRIAAALSRGQSKDVDLSRYDEPVADAPPAPPRGHAKAGPLLALGVACILLGVVAVARRRGGKG